MVSKKFHTFKFQQSTHPSSQSLISAQSSLQQQQQSMQQIPQQQGQVGQPSLLQTTSQTHQPMIETQGANAMQHNSGGNSGSASIVITSQATQTLAMAATDRNAIYMAPMSRPVPIGQQSGVSQVTVSKNMVSKMLLQSSTEVIS